MVVLPFKSIRGECPYSINEEDIPISNFHHRFFCIYKIKQWPPWFKEKKIKQMYKNETHIHNSYWLLLSSLVNDITKNKTSSKYERNKNLN